MARVLLLYMPLSSLNACSCCIWHNIEGANPQKSLEIDDVVINKAFAFSQLQEHVLEEYVRACVSMSIILGRGKSEAKGTRFLGFLCQTFLGDVGKMGRDKRRLSHVQN